jgi:hypothetical protein
MPIKKPGAYEINNSDKDKNTQRLNKIVYEIF